MKIEDIKHLYRLVDRLDVASLRDHLSPQAEIVPGNADPLRGLEDICDAVEHFFLHLDGIHHEIHDIWRAGSEGTGPFVAHADAYFRVRGREGAIMVRGASIFEVRDGLITSCRLFYDLGAVRAQIEHPDRVFETLDETFPASDSPGWNP